MAISTNTEALIELYNQKISLDIQQLSQINTLQQGYTIKTGIGETDKIKIWGPSEVIENYNVPIKKLDNKIVEINIQITNLQSQILGIGQSANSVGCGSTGVGFTTVFQDQINYKGYSFSGSNPFSPISGALNLGNSGIGTNDYVTQVAIGSYFSDLETCYNLFGLDPCTNGMCAEYKTSIDALIIEISDLQTERDSLIEKVNILKSARSEFEIQNYSYNRSKQQLNTSIGISSSIISFLQNPNNDEWL